MALLRALGHGLEQIDLVAELVAAVQHIAQGECGDFLDPKAEAEGQIDERGVAFRVAVGADDLEQALQIGLGEDAGLAFAWHEW